MGVSVAHPRLRRLGWTLIGISGAWIAVHIAMAPTVAPSAPPRSQADLAADFWLVLAGGFAVSRSRVLDIGRDRATRAWVVFLGATALPIWSVFLVGGDPMAHGLWSRIWVLDCSAMAIGLTLAMVATIQYLGDRLGERFPSGTSAPFDRWVHRDTTSLIRPREPAEFGELVDEHHVRKSL